MLFRYSVLLALISIGAIVRGIDVDLPADEEKDNQFPLEPSSDGQIEGSGGGEVNEAGDTVTTEIIPTATIEEVEPTAIIGQDDFSSVDGLKCPDTCTCSEEGSDDSYNFVTDCAMKDFLAIPETIDDRTTSLNLQNNKITEIPKSISRLKNLKFLNANDNSITDVDFGSLSELSELKKLQLANNRILEIPQDIKNAISLTKLQELDLGGNDIREEITAETFTKFSKLEKIVLPVLTGPVISSLCSSLNETLHTICIDSCNSKLVECEDIVDNLTTDEIPALPGAIAADLFTDEELNSTAGIIENKLIPVINTDLGLIPTLLDENIISTTEFSLRNIVDNKETFGDNIAPVNPDTNSNVISSRTNKKSNIEMQPDDTSDVKGGNIEAAKDEAASENINKSVIGLIAAGMIVIVAGVIIKRNWSSIKNRFSSTPRAPLPADRTNGTLPEEMPLQEKSPV